MSNMKEDNTKLKRSLVVQSFAPLFLLLAIKNSFVCEYIRLFRTFFSNLFNADFSVFVRAIQHPRFGALTIFVISIFWLIYTIIVAIGFKGIQQSGFKATGEKIIICEDNGDGSASFLLTFILPLLTDGIDNIRNLIAFLVLLLMVILLLINTKSFYQNPVLAMLQYKAFTFKFRNPDNDVDDKKVYIGITQKNMVVEEAVIKRKYIGDGVFLIYND